jgi:threonine dehydratase
MLACRIIGLQILPHGDVLAGLTPIVNVNADQFDARLGSFTMTLKLEQLQHAGSFKTRCAFARRRSRGGRGA